MKIALGGALYAISGNINSVEEAARYAESLYCTVLYCTVLYCTVLYCTVLYCTVLYCTVCTVLYQQVEQVVAVSMSGLVQIYQPSNHAEVTNRPIQCYHGVNEVF